MLIAGAPVMALPVPWDQSGGHGDATHPAVANADTVPSSAPTNTTSVATPGCTPSGLPGADDHSGAHVAAPHPSGAEHDESTADGRDQHGVG